MAKKMNLANEFIKEQLIKKNLVETIGARQVQAEAKNEANKEFLETNDRHKRFKTRQANKIFDAAFTEKQDKAIRAGTPAHEATQAFMHQITALKYLNEKMITRCTDALALHCEDFVTGLIDLKTFKQKCAATLNGAKTDLSSQMTRKPETILEHISVAMQSLFRILDNAVSWMLKSEKTMAESYTLGAKTLTGRDHFFNAPETKLGTEMRQFKETLEKLENEASIGSPKPAK